MRFHERCPKCGHVETVNWRPRFMDVEQDIVEVEAIPELAARLTPGEPLVDGQWTYYMSRPRRWVARMLTVAFKADGKWRSRRPYLLGNESGRRKMAQRYNQNRAGRNG